MARQVTATRSAAAGGGQKLSRRSESFIQKLFKNPKIPFACALLFSDAVLVFLIITYIPYTKIDWDAYMSQILFGVLYVVNLGMVLLLYLKTDVAMNIFGVISALAGAALVQILVGLPFLLSYPIAYISRAFNLGRIFIHFWSVNFKFVPEPVFVSKGFALLLLAVHLILLAIFAHYRWCKHEGGLFSLLHSRLAQMKLKTAYTSSFALKQINSSNSNFRVLTTEHIATTMFVGNFIGIVCARSLHYQFYSWYFYSLPYLLWRTTFPSWLRLVLFTAVEFCWNVYPSNMYSSLLLLVAHLIILGGLWSAPPEYPYVNNTNDKSEKLKKRAS
ncbi:hypothetical protein ACJIZ3_011651 [Penstemon smallii]|uniref:dolichyl-P-Man:Man5GlcNAc2-PP-dolichol alpha-1,3-mannosyltransferase n=1 Tax=Penstemon smallii TaxID=265156 RepID=A0ABD3UJQ4_9LAMI